MRSLGYGDVPDQPWRNGRGTTRELHRDERWRLSIATLTAPGDFSTFDGVDRTFVLARGAVDLDVGAAVHRLTAGELLRFAGEVRVVAHHEGDVTAVNVMTTRPLRATVVVGEWSGTPAVAVVDLTTLETHVGVTGAEETGPLEWAVVVEGIS